jgi:GxxExxY protein
MPPTDELDRLASEIVDASLCVHRELGPGLLESAYQVCLNQVLIERGIAVRQEVILPVVFRGVQLDANYRLDMIVGELIVIENKSVQQIHAVHIAQLITYLKLSGFRLGFLINWNVHRIKDGLRRIIHG